MGMHMSGQTIPVVVVCMMLKAVYVWSMISPNATALECAPAPQARGGHREHRGISSCHHSFVGLASVGWP